MWEESSQSMGYHSMLDGDSDVLMFLNFTKKKGMGGDRSIFFLSHFHERLSKVVSEAHFNVYIEKIYLNQTLRFL